MTLPDASSVAEKVSVAGIAGAGSIELDAGSSDEEDDADDELCTGREALDIEDDDSLGADDAALEDIIDADDDSIADDAAISDGDEAEDDGAAADEDDEDGSGAEELLGGSSGAIDVTSGVETLDEL